ncbi:MAG: biotin/lipoyl-binding protein, partial [Polyangia bacterium]
MSGRDKLLPEHRGTKVDDHLLPAHESKDSAAAGKKAKGKGWEPNDEQDDELEFELPPPATVSRRKGLLFVVITAVVVVLLFIVGFVPRWRQRRVIDEEARRTSQAAPRVELVSPKEMAQDRPLQLPGITEALEDTVVYPRVSGYVRRWLVDIGDLVKEGQQLAEIDTPELDAQLEQARADLVQAEANVLRAETSSTLSSTEQKRYETLTPAGVTSGQELAQRRTQARVDDANVKVAKATVASMQANVNRLVRTKAFARPVAPFSGTVTARTI